VFLRPFRVRDVLSHTACCVLGRSQQAFAQRVRVDEPGESGLAVDLDDRQPLAVARLELGIAVDLDHLEGELDVLPDAVEDLERGVAEVTAATDEDGDSRAGYG
jgi:hypothetical protein